MKPFAAMVVSGLLMALPAAARAETPASRPATRACLELGLHLADYDAEPRLASGRVDVDALTARLKELKATTYYWLVWHAATDWDDLKLFLPKAAETRIQVWVYLVPPSESPPHTGRYSEPFRCDYQRWAEEIARLSLANPNLTAWVIDDFCANRELFTPEYVGKMQSRARQVNAKLAFLPLMYFGEIAPAFTERYGQVMDGVVAAYPQDRRNIECADAVLRGASAAPGQLNCPAGVPSKAGDFASATVSAKVLPGERHTVAFRERDDYTGPTAGYHFKQLLIDDVVVWEEDVAGGTADFRRVTVDVGRQVAGRAGVALTFRLLDKKAVGNFGVCWDVADLQADGLQPDADLREPQKWRADRRGVLVSGFGELQRKPAAWRIPLVVMTAAEAEEFRMRHGDPASARRMADWLDMCLQARRQGLCDGVATYCLDKGDKSEVFALAAKLYEEARQKR